MSKTLVRDMLKFIHENKDDEKWQSYIKSAEECLCEFREECIQKLRKLICADYPAVNVKEYEILGRAIQGCNQISILDDGSVFNTYNYSRKNTKAMWKAEELIDSAINELEKEREGE